MKLNDYYNYLIDTNIANEETLKVITCINGYNMQTLDNVLYCQTGYRDIKQYLEYEDPETYKEYYTEEAEEDE